MRKIWLAISVISALAAGWILYDSLIVGLYYQDRRQGVLLLAAGIGICALYARSICKFAEPVRKVLEEYGEEKTAQEQGMDEGKIKRNRLWNGAAMGMAAAGIAVYLLRYQSIYRIAFAAVLALGAGVGVFVLIPLIWEAHKSM